MNDQPYGDCRLCPRNCGVDRTRGATGFCGETATLRIASIGPHFGEEPSFSGTRGSGTVFFTGCSTRCFFCQNYQISQQGMGKPYTMEAFIEACRNMVAQGVHNINFVTPDHFWPHIEALCAALRDEGVTVPFLLNGSGYHRPDRIDAYAALVDIFMPDFKFADRALAATCMQDENYPAIALESLRRMVDLKG
ncbi:MAG: radical SAM protein, partial [Spartobacteria bacterium]|nr:radical SAM protein [Spartobacteria bacterium]